MALGPRLTAYSCGAAADHPPEGWNFTHSRFNPLGSLSHQGSLEWVQTIQPRAWIPTQISAPITTVAKSEPSKRERRADADHAVIGLDHAERHDDGAEGRRAIGARPAGSA